LLSEAALKFCRDVERCSGRLLESQTRVLPFEASALLNGGKKAMNEPSIHINDRGSGSPTLIFLHYFAGSSRSWIHVTDRLVDASRCVSLDLPGFGLSPPLPGFSVRTMERVVTRLVSDLNLDSYIVVGHSMGAKLAMACAITKLSGLEGLVLVAPSPPSSEPMNEGERNRLLRSHGDRASAEQTIHSITRQPLRANDFTICIEDNLATSLEAWRWWLESGSRENFASETSRIDCPVLVLAGGNDPVIPPHVATSDVAARIKGAICVEIPHVGHLLPFEASHEVSRAIQSFVVRHHLGQ
jgi:pimeloyl-ACP methyl ester carboxylesterase